MDEGSGRPALAGALDAYYEAGEGMALPRFRTGVDAARQAHYHRCCEIDGGGFAGQADVTILAQDNSRATTKASLPNDGRVHTRQVIRQRQPVPVGEALVVTGRIGGYRDSRRGRLLTCLFAYLRSDGSVPLEMECEYLLPFAEPPPAPAPGDAPRQGRGSPPDAGAWTTATTLALTPARVTAYSEEVGNQIHFDPEFARARGYRAPLAQGLMQLTCMHAALVAALGAPAGMDLEVRFLRPVFWDDTLQIQHTRDHRLFRCSTDDSRSTAEMTVARLDFGR